MASHPRMEAILGSLDTLRPVERDARMQELLGLAGNEPQDETTLTDEQVEDARAFQALAVAVEKAIQSTSAELKPGLDWE